MRTAKAHGETKTLVATKSAVGTHLAGSLHHGQSHKVGSHTDKDTLLVALGYELGVVANFTKLVGVLNHDSEILGSIEIEILHIAGFNLNVAGSGIGAHHVESLRQYAIVDENLVHTVFLSLAAAAGKEHQHALATCSGLVQQAGIGHRHVGHVGHHGLISHQGFETALADFSLVRGVGGIPTSVLKYIALDNSGGNGAVVTHTDIGLIQFVFLSQRAATVQELILVDAIGNGHRFFKADSSRHSLVDKFIHRTDADFFQHLLFFNRVGDTVVSRGEIVTNHIVMLLLI